MRGATAALAFRRLAALSPLALVLVLLLLLAARVHVASGAPTLSAYYRFENDYKDGTAAARHLAQQTATTSFAAGQYGQGVVLSGGTLGQAGYALPYGFPVRPDLLLFACLPSDSC